MHPSVCLCLQADIISTYKSVCLYANTNPFSALTCVSVSQADIESTYKERDQSQCWDIRDEYIRNFLHNELVTGGCSSC